MASTDADQRVEVRGAVLEQRDGRLARQRLEARRIDGQRLLDGRARLVAMVFVEREVGQHEKRRHQRRVQAQRARHQLARGRAALVGKRAGQPGKGGGVSAIALQRGPEGPHRLGAILLVEEQLAPGDLERGVVADQRGGVAKQRVGLLVAAKPVCGARSTAQHLAVVGARGRGHHRLEQAARLGRAPAQQLQLSEFELRVAKRRQRDAGGKRRRGLVVLARWRRARARAATGRRRRPASARVSSMASA